MRFCSKRNQNKDAYLKLYHKLYFVIGYVVIIFLVAALISKYWFQLMLIQGESMEPTYHSFQIVIIEKKYADIECGDVIAFNSRELNRTLVKRIIGTPSQSVVIRDGTLYIDGQESPLYKDQFIEYAGTFDKEIVLESGEYAVLGDNLSESIDSRYPEVGIINDTSIIGRVIQ